MKLTFETLVQHLPNKIWIADATGKMVFVNRRWVEFTGRDVDWLNTHPYSTVHPDDVDATRALWELAKQTGKSFEANYRIRGIDGRWCWHVIRGSAVYEDGVLQGWIGECTDTESFLMGNVRDYLQNVGSWFSSLQDIVDVAKEMHDR